MPTDYNPNPNATSSLAGWSKGGTATTLVATAEGARWVGGSSGTGRYVQITVAGSSLPDYQYMRVAGLQVQRTSGTAQLSKLRMVVSGISDQECSLDDYALGPSYATRFGPLPWNYPGVSGGTENLVIQIYAENDKPFDYRIHHVGLYVNGDFPALPDLDASDAGFSYTQTDNSLTATVSYVPGDEAVDALSWNWGDGTAATTGPAGGSGNKAVASHTYAAPGVYTVQCTATTHWGKTSPTDPVPVADSYAGPTKAITVPVGPLSAAYAAETDFLNIVTDASSSVAPSLSPIDTYAWDWGDGTTSAASGSPYGSHTYAAPGTYNVTLTVHDTATGRTDTEVKPWAMSAAPNPDNYFTALKDLLAVAFVPSIQTGTTYAWVFGDGGSSSAKEPTHTYADPGTYAVTLTVDGTLTTTQDVTVTAAYAPLGALMDALKLEVSVPYAPGAIYNRLLNPSGELGSWAWVTPVTNGYLTGSVTDNQAADKGVAGAKLIYRSSGASTQYAASVPVRVVAGQYVSAQLQSPYVDGYYRAQVDAYNAAGALLGSSAMTGYQQASPTAVVRTTPYLLPAGTATARVALYFYSNTSNGVPAVNKLFQFRRVMLATAATSGELTALPYAEYANWTNLIGPTSSIETDRSALNLGTLKALILDSAYDPAVDGRIRPGQTVRLRARGQDSSGNLQWRSIYTGTVNNADVEYVAVKGATPGPKATRITLSATDAVTPLSRTSEPRGVAKIAELPELLEGGSVPFEVNGSSGQVPAASVVAWNDNASLLDQVAIARDTDGGYAYVDVDGVLQVREPAYMPTAAVGVIDERAYSGIAAGFNTDGCINSVTIKWLRYTPAVGDEPPSVVEVPYGPYEDTESIDEWGIHTATYTMQGVESPSLIAAKAQDILDANSQPVRLITSTTLPIRYQEDLTEARALLDLYSLVRLGYARTSTDELARVTSVKHSIEATRDGGRWRMALGFDADGTVAGPQLTAPPPAPPEAVDTGWVNLTYSANWADLGSIYQVGQYRRQNGRVRLRGLVQSSIARTATAVIAVLPVGCRPAASEIFSAVSTSTLTSGAASAGTAHTHVIPQFGARVDVAATGSVQLMAAAATPLPTSGWVSLAGIEFDVD